MFFFSKWFHPRKEFSSIIINAHVYITADDKMYWIMHLNNLIKSHPRWCVFDQIYGQIKKESNHLDMLFANAVPKKISIICLVSIAKVFCLLYKIDNIKCYSLIKMQVCNKIRSFNVEAYFVSCPHFANHVHVQSHFYIVDNLQ